MTKEEKEEFDRWNDTVLKEMDQETENMERRHGEKRDSFDITLCDRDCEEDEYVDPAKLSKLGQNEDFLDIIYSKKYQDLHEFVTDNELSPIIKSLTTKQKEALYLTVILKYKTPEVAAMRGTSDRNIRKLKREAIENIRKESIPILKKRPSLTKWQKDFLERQKTPENSKRK